MRVLHITPYFAPAFVYGGPPRSILGLCKALRKVQVEVEVFTTTANGLGEFDLSVAQRRSYESVPVRYFPRTFPKRFFRSSALAKTLAEVIGEYDLLHLHGVWNLTGWEAARQARKRGIPYIISPRGMLDAGSMAHKRWRKRLAFDAMEKQNLAGAAFLHASSEAEAEALQSYDLGTRVFVLANGVEVPAAFPPRRAQVRQQLQLGAEHKIVLFLGRIHPVKRLDLLAQAFAQILPTWPNARLVIAGPNENDYRQQLAPYFQALRGAVHWVGEVETSRKWALLQEADVLVMCSDSESFGVSVAEAMFAGLPVVTTRTCPWSEIETVGCGYWVAQDPGAIAEALRNVLQDSSEAQAMGKRGQELAEARYRWETIAEQMAHYYQQAIQRAGTKTK